MPKIWSAGYFLESSLRTLSDTERASFSIPSPAATIAFKMALVMRVWSNGTSRPSRFLMEANITAFICSKFTVVILKHQKVLWIKNIPMYIGILLFTEFPAAPAMATTAAIRDNRSHFMATATAPIRVKIVRRYIESVISVAPITFTARLRDLLCLGHWAAAAPIMALARACNREMAGAATVVVSAVTLTKFCKVTIRSEER